MDRLLDQPAGPAVGSSGLLDHFPRPVASPLSDNGFDRLFSPDPAPGRDFPLFTDGLSALDGGSGLGGDAFTFDSLVDFDADQSFVDLGDDHGGPLDPVSAPTATDLSHPFAATITGLQPSFGAPFEGRDGPGIAADV